MVSVGTQTPSSWLSDERILKAADVTKVTPESFHLPELAVFSSEPRQSRGEERETEELSLPRIVSPPGRERHSTPEQLSNDLSSELRDLSLGDSGGGGGRENRVIVPLTQLEFPDNSSSDGHTSEEEEEEEDDTTLVLTDTPAPYPELCVSQFSWPAILQYLRESESEASKYFSNAKGAAAHRKMKNDETKHHLLAKEDNILTEQKETGDESARPVVERMSRECDFCGQPAAQWSMLRPTTGDGVPQTEPCCGQFKEYCLLVAACLQQMMAERVSAQPAEISVRLNNKRDAKTTAEEKAFALIKRRQRWEELQRKRKKKKNKTLQSSSFYSLTKQTRTIQFSLLSPAVLSTGWMQRERPGRQRKGKEKRRGKRKGGSRNLPSDVLEMLKTTVPLTRPLEVKMYEGSTRPFCTLLPDHSGQYFYPSGSVALLIYSHIPGLFSYLFYNDTEGGGGDLLCYADELGRVFCYYHDSSLRLQISASGEGVMYSPKGEIVKRWRWGDVVGEETEHQLSPFQPFSLSLNKLLVLQCTGRNQLLFSLSVQHQHVKFTIPRKLKSLSCVSEVDRSLLGHCDSYSQYLTHMQSQIKCLQATLGSKRGGGRPSAMTGQRARHRSHSVGALTFTTHPSSSRKLV